MTVQFETAKQESEQTLEEFSVVCLSALSSLISDDQAIGTKHRFLRKFEERSALPWLGESGQTLEATKDTALAYGMSHALAMYTVPLARRNHRYASSYGLEVTPSEQASLEKAVGQVALFPNALKAFGHSLISTGIAVEKMPRHSVVKHVRHAFEFYASGTNDDGSDPW